MGWECKISEGRDDGGGGRQIVRCIQRKRLAVPEQGKTSCSRRLVRACHRDDEAKDRHRIFWLSRTRQAAATARNNRVADQMLCGQPLPAGYARLPGIDYLA
jgi:hypothetical protein